jgi:hypothetical protein
MTLALIAHVAFWVLAVITAIQVGWRSALLFLGLWVIGYVGSGWLTLVGGYLFGSYVALLDVALVFVLKLRS